MLEPKNDRFDYGEQLNAPDGFELFAAIATTYSLDLDALLSVSVALGFKDTLEGDLSGEKLVLLEAISGLKDKLKVFYQKGKMNIPLEYNYLFTLLEPCLSPIVPAGGEFSSFHPKLWLLRYVESAKKSKQEVRYRLIVLTRNLTFDRSWDLAVSIDGKVMKEKQSKDEKGDWIDFFKTLLKNEKTFAPKSIFKKEMPYIKWKMMKNTWGEKLLPGGGNKRPLVFRNIDSIMVVSPFIKDAGNQIKALDWLGSHVPEGGNKLLFSRAEELNAIGEERLMGWECYAINSAIVEGEERLEEGVERHNLHAKLIVTQRDNVVDWHLGSANTTSAALGDASQDPRNTEFMVRFSGYSTQIGSAALMKQWVGEEGQGLFVPHLFETIDDLEDTEGSTRLRSMIFALISAEWLLEGAIDSTGTYMLTLKVDSPTLFKKIKCSGARVEVDQLAIAGSKKVLTEQMQWNNVQLTQISAFILISIRLPHMEEEIAERVLLQVPIELEGGDTRYQGILKKMLDSNEKVLNYIRMLLNPDSDKNEWLAHEKNRGNGANSEIDIFDTDTPLFEQLMFTASRHPEALERLEALIVNLEESNIEIPKEFKALWKHFRMGVRKDG